MFTVQTQLLESLLWQSMESRSRVELQHDVCFFLSALCSCSADLSNSAHPKETDAKNQERSFFIRLRNNVNRLLGILLQTRILPDLFFFRVSHTQIVGMIYHLYALPATNSCESRKDWGKTNNRDGPTYLQQFQWLHENVSF